ncbi:uncharacterized protein N7506_001649 [Penicillium brevicompactum]|uniref:uncharacterized protein n=1 Tax=Penicillium brevicompactum TaxID=5074 RepID=UPI002541A0C3|nr:uncharacterized protein N7506_001649 [Penicillium brevicompactum]KAJ5348396.1 hypothetical protein N7506_001649 [Penicillium brevicompactum]
MPGDKDSGDEVAASDRPIRKRTRTGCVAGAAANVMEPDLDVVADAAALCAVEERRGANLSQFQQFIDETEVTVDGYSTPDRLSDCFSCEPEGSVPNLPSPSSISHTPSRTVTGALSIADLVDHHDLPTSDLPSSLSGDNLDVSSLPNTELLEQVSDGPFLEEQDHACPFFLGQARFQANIQDTVLPVTEAEKLQLISAFLRETGTWCETTDSQMHFTVKSIHEMMKSPSFVAAALSLASRQLDYVQGRQRPVTLELYQFTIQLLLCQDPAQADTSILATCTLLCVYEMMASRIEEWRRHLKGCAGFLRAQKWNGSSEGIVKASFWAFARIDVWAAFNSGKATLIPTESWVDNMSIDYVLANGDLDEYCNLAILIFAKIVNALSNFHVSQASAFKATASALWHELQTWKSLSRNGVHKISAQYGLTSLDHENSANIPDCGNTFFHSGCMLLLQTGILVRGVEDGYQHSHGDTHNIFWHARELVGSSMSNPSHANWVNQLQPLFIAGTVFGNSVATPVIRDIMSGSKSDGHTAREDYEDDNYCSEKIILLKHLAKIERETGWKTSDRAAELRKLWGFA